MYKKFNLSNLVTTKNMLEKAYKEKYAVAAFNVHNLEWSRAALEVAQELNAPIILAVSKRGGEWFGSFASGVNLIVNLMKDLKITIPVAIHLDHGGSYEICKDALEAGFTSIMFDGSANSIDRNINETKKVVELCHKYGVPVEAEVGTIGGEEDGVVGDVLYAKLDHCVRMKNEAHVDYIAAAVGSVHGHYKGKPKFGFDRMQKISEAIKIPMVLHGGSGILDDQIKKAISLGEAKINVNTECQDHYCAAVKQYFVDKKDLLVHGYDSRKIQTAGMNAVKVAMREKILLFGSNNKA
ncbi:class II fructose-bisphosphate aldolase [Mycoplasma sp. SG1]|uniref:class II fructose-bisphosphate aldolase n=1 Tax=Mycoplasma sp. SG1 TaxID=2810348 RepID=UPI0020251486|nr:ketose-bisphosphate aldolase [Mycoplasma sp. SG1]URM52859.1 ketose-bisphosphate aldolase [Mycoplasma sp. SG1]